ncbi:AsmA family protein, partial [Acidocella sp.]|uniref:AsmA family protein n=1 Tax=Acidocella sp. TaxID=50710 RepID=UPI002613E297
MDRQRPPISRQPARPRRRWPAILLCILLLLILLPLAALGVFIARFNPNSYAPQIIAALEQATGRTLTLGGPLRLRLSLTPTLTANRISLSNPPGFASPSLLTLDEVQAQIALLPLLRHRLDILKLRLEGPQLYLERDAAGRADWDFARPAPPPGGGAPPAPPSRGYSLALEAVEVDNGRIIIQTQGQTPAIIQLTRLTGQAASLTAPLRLSGAAAIGAAPLTVQGLVGPVARLTGGAGNEPWPVDLTLGFAGASARLQGAVARPQNARGYDLTLTAAIPALEAIGAALPPGLTGGLALPALHQVSVSARITDQNAPLPAITNASVKAGASDLSALRSGLSLTTLDLELPALTQPVTFTAAGMMGALPFAIRARATAPSAFLAPALLPASAPPAASFSETLQASLGNANLTLNGGIATPRGLSGAALALTLDIPDLAALSPAAGQALPGWKNIAVRTTLIDPGGQGLATALGADSLTATMDNASFGGDASLTLKPRRRLELDLAIANADFDKLLAVLPQPQPSPPGAAAGAPPASAPARLIPAYPLPLALLRGASADIQLSATQFTLGHANYTAVQGHAALNNGVLTIAPLTGQLPGGAVSASASVDAAREPAAETLRLTAPALALGPFLGALGLPDVGEGTVQAALDASATGDDLRAMAASVSGRLGLASVNGVVDGAVIGRLFGAALRAAGLPASLA